MRVYWVLKDEESFMNITIDSTKLESFLSEIHLYGTFQFILDSNSTSNARALNK